MPDGRANDNRIPRGVAEVWWAGQDSNLQPDRYERPALTIELPARFRWRSGSMGSYTAGY
jgi:hypothetical protein